MAVITVSEVPLDGLYLATECTLCSQLHLTTAGLCRPENYQYSSREFVPVDLSSAPAFLKHNDVQRDG